MNVLGGHTISAVGLRRQQKLAGLMEYRVAGASECRMVKAIVAGLAAAGVAVAESCWCWASSNPELKCTKDPLCIGLLGQAGARHCAALWLRASCSSKAVVCQEASLCQVGLAEASRGGCGFIMHCSSGVSCSPINQGLGLGLG